VVYDLIARICPERDSVYDLTAIDICDACRQCQYIGLCYGSPGVGKTLSARRYSRWDKIKGVKTRDLSDAQLQEFAQLDVVLYTTPVVNPPREIERDIGRLRHLLLDFFREPVRREETRILKEIEKRDDDPQSTFFSEHDWLAEKLPTLEPTFGQCAASTPLDSAPWVIPRASFWLMKPIV
jgi:hypothetical protein